MKILKPSLIHEKVMVFGTFDGFHPGHLNFFKQAKKFGDYLIIVVARDINVKKFKGRLPKFGERKRLAEVREEIKRLRDQEIKRSRNRVILGSLKDPMAMIRKFKPEVICLGYDQKSFDAKLKKQFQKIGIIRLKPYKANIYKSSKLKKL